MNEPIYLTTPVGRFVMGDAFTGSDKDAQGRPKFDKTGKPRFQWFMGLAIPQNDPEWPAVWQQITQVGQRDFPAGAWQLPTFAWKVANGDGVNQDGKPYPDHCKGCFILKMSNGFAPTIYNAQNQQIVDPTQCKRGDYVRAYISIVGNGDTQKPGVYINHSMIQVVGFGQAIVSGPSAAEVFVRPVALPPGASAVPVAPAGGMPAPAGAPMVPGVVAPTAPGLPPMAGAAGPVNPTVYPGNPGVPVAGATAPGVQPYPQILNGPTR